MLQDKINEAAEHLLKGLGSLSELPKVAIVLGSGLDSFSEGIEPVLEVNYRDIPHFPTPSVVGHAGILTIGKLGGMPLLVFRGRTHMYEGFSPDQVTFSMRLAKRLGIAHMILTNAVGAMRETLYLGALVVVEDHINFSFKNPLIGPNLDQSGPRFPDMSTAYHPHWQRVALAVAKAEGIRLHTGVLGSILGPSYMSTAEHKMLRRLGADIVGMSTVPEAIVANHEGMSLLAISCVTDMVVPEIVEPIDHDMVLRVARQTRPKFAQLITALLAQYHAEPRKNTNECH